MRIFLYHGLEVWLIIHTLSNNPLYNTRMTLDATIERALINKSFDKAYALIKDIAQNHH